MIRTFKPTCRHGLHLVPFQIICQLSSRFGTVLAFKLIACYKFVYFRSADY